MTCPTLHPSPKIPANLRARVQQPSPTSRPNLPRLLRWNPDADSNARHTGLTRRRRSTSSSSGSSSDSSSSSTSSSSDGSDHCRRKRSSRRHGKSRSKRHHRHRSSSSSVSSTDSPLISCVSTPARWVLKKIKRGQYTDFDKWLSPTDDAVPGPKKSRKTKRQVCDLQTRNLPSELKHPDIIDAELSKEIAAGRILGPFSEHLLTNQCTSGLGAVPKKNGKWRVIMHLSAPEGIGINDYIDKEDFPIRYATVDDAVAMVTEYGKECIKAKIDLKAASSAWYPS
eukprot:Em0024g449a